MNNIQISNEQIYLLNFVEIFEFKFTEIFNYLHTHLIVTPKRKWSPARAKMKSRFI